MRNLAARLWAGTVIAGLALGMHATPRALAGTWASRPTLVSSGPHTAAGLRSRVAHSQVDAVCTIKTSDPTHANGRISGDGDQVCSGPDFAVQSIMVTVQQQRGGPIWEDKQSTGWTPWSADHIVSATVSWPCAPGTGRQNYRIVTDGKFADISGQVHHGLGVYSGRILTATCPP
jgi:hypothetical protein